jgi:hypothetical protein
MQSPEIQPRHNPAAERRRHPRTLSETTAVVTGAGFLHRYEVENLSASGALLSGRIGLEVGRIVDVILQMPLYPEIRVMARVMRYGRSEGGRVLLDVEFVHVTDTTEDHIQAALLSELERSSTHGSIAAVTEGADLD